jgi:F-type H+-transporting ATPase subunit c
MMNRNVKFLLMMASAFVVMGVSTVVFAQDLSAAEAAAEAARQNAMDLARISNGAGIAIACGLGIGLAALGGAIGQGKTAAAALEGIARNPASADRIFMPMILGLALIESLVIYALVIALMLQGKIG